MRLKGLHGVVYVGIQTRPWGGINDGSKCLDQGDNRDEGGTCTRHEVLCSRGAQGAMKTSHGNAKSE